MALLSIAVLVAAEVCGYGAAHVLYPHFRALAPPGDPELFATGHTGLFLSLHQLAAAPVGVLVIAGLLWLHPQPIRTFVGRLGFQPREAAVWGGALAAAWLAAQAASQILGQPLVWEWVLAVYATRGSTLLFWLAVVVAAPVFEELLFRGFLQRGLIAASVRPAWAIVLSTAAFTVLHIQYDALALALVFASSLILGAAYHRTGSIGLAVGLHALINTAGTGAVHYALYH